MAEGSAYTYTCRGSAEMQRQWGDVRVCNSPIHEFKLNSNYDLQVFTVPVLKLRHLISRYVLAEGGCPPRPRPRSHQLQWYTHAIDVIFRAVPTAAPYQVCHSLGSAPPCSCIVEMSANAHMFQVITWFRRCNPGQYTGCYCGVDGGHAV